MLFFCFPLILWSLLQKTNNILFFIKIICVMIVVLCQLLTTNVELTMRELHVCIAGRLGEVKIVLFAEQKNPEVWQFYPCHLG